MAQQGWETFYELHFHESWHLLMLARDMCISASAVSPEDNLQPWANMAVCFPVGNHSDPGWKPRSILKISPQVTPLHHSWQGTQQPWALVGRNPCTNVLVASPTGSEAT